MAAATQFKIEAIVKGTENVEGLKNAVKRLQGSVPAAANDLNRLREVTANLGKATDLTENALRAQISVMRDLRANVKFLGDDYRKLTVEIQKAERQLAKGEGGGPGGGRLKRFGQTAGAVAASGVFGGPEGLVGAGIGAAFGGPAGALAGGAIGAQASMVRQQAAGVADYVKQLNLAKITLAQASSGQDEYNRQLQVARNISQDYTVGLRETIQGYSQVSVAAKANGLTLQQTEQIYRGLISAGVAFGKSQEDLDAIVRATVQVLSKGKLSAEELQGQIGERLPGAVAKFAAATGRSLSQLSKDLQDGKVSIADFVKFTEKQVQDYDQIAKIIGDSPEKAGERLKLALDTAAENYGGFFQQIGASIQNYSAQLVSFVNTNQRGLKQWVVDWANAIANIVSNLKGLFNYFAGFIKRFIALMQYNPGVFLANKFGEYVRGVAGKDKQGGKGPFTVENLFPEFKPSAGAFGAGAPVAGLQDMLSADGGKAGRAAADKAAGEREQAMKRYESAVKAAKEAVKDLNREVVTGAYETDLLGASAFEALNMKWLRGADLVEQEIEDLNERLGKLNEDRADALKFNIPTDAIDIQITKFTNAINNLKQVSIGQNDAEFAQSVSELLGKEVEIVDEAVRAYYDLADAKNYNIQVTDGLKNGVNAYIEQIGTLSEAVSSLAQNAFQGVEDAIFDLVTTGSTNFRAFAADILKQTSRMIIQQLVLKSIMQAFGFGGGGFSPLSNASATNFGFNPGAMTGGMDWTFAKGGAFAQNNILPFAQGGIVNSPTLFKFANGGAMRNGIMGEAGPEAIIPLRRGRDGKLGVAGGGGNTTVNVSVDAKGTSVQGNAGQGEALARAVAQAVQAELVKQKRPGGLIAA